MIARHRRDIALALSILAWTGAPAHANDPTLAPGRDPSGAAVAVLADGFDYTRPEVAKVLARDGEGEVIAWDAMDADHRPFARDGRGTDTAIAVSAKGGVRVVAVRVAAADPVSLAQGVAFAIGTPARIVLAPLADTERAGLTVMTAAARRFETALFVVSVPRPTTDEKKLDEGLPNLVLLDSADNAHAAAEAVARVLGCGRGALTGSTGAALKSAFLSRLGETSSAPCNAEGDKKTDQR